MGLIVPNSIVLDVGRKVGQSNREVDPEGSTLQKTVEINLRKTLMNLQRICRN